MNAHTAGLRKAMKAVRKEENEYLQQERKMQILLLSHYIGRQNFHWTELECRIEAAKWYLDGKRISAGSLFQL